MKKLVIITAACFTLMSCKGKQVTKSNQTEVSPNASVETAVVEKTSAPASKEVAEEKTKAEETVNPHVRIRDFDWYVGNWSKLAYEDYWGYEKDEETVGLEIKKEDEKYTAVLTEGEKVSEGELYVDKYFLPKNLPEEEQLNYDNSDYLVADFNGLRYWISICYDGSKRDRIALNLGDIDVYLLERGE